MHAGGCGISTFPEKVLFLQEKRGWCLTGVGACDKPLHHDPFGQLAGFWLPKQYWAPQAETIPGRLQHRN
jgi:hypothetical protein